jgi:predicted nuclease of restriction endonuclease-like (RecB) superfamily
MVNKLRTGKVGGRVARVPSDLGSPEYQAFLDGLKVRVREARGRAALSANRELVLLYWNIGRDILTRQAKLGWGAKVIDRLSRDLGGEFPEMKGLSSRNLKYMRAFAEAWPDEVIVQQRVALLPWGHIARILDKVSEPASRKFYVDQATQHGWSRDLLVTHIDRNLVARQGNAVTNFERTLASPQHALASHALKDPYVFDFLGLAEDAEERAIEQALVLHIRNTLVEMGVGFAFVGHQYKLEVAGEDFFIDVLFYHLRLHCYVVVELKAGEFRPEHAGKLNFYLSAVDDLVRDPAIDGPSIGLLLCKSKNRLMAEYALRDIHKPIGVANLELTRLLPEGLTSSLPTVEALESELGELPEPTPTEE